MKYLLLLLCLTPLLFAFGSAGEWKSLSKNKMTVRWKFDGDRVHFEVSAPRQGWVAIGFNPKSGLTGTHLIMGAVHDGQTTVSDRYVRKPGDYPAIADIGGQPQVADVRGSENAKGTTVCFSLPVGFESGHHYALRPGKRYHLLLAYSMADEFDHHSIMRTETNITL